MNRLLFLSTILMISLSLSSCHNFEGPTGPKLKGNLVGWTFLSGQRSETMESHSGVKISIEGTQYETSTDLYGYWELSDINAGTYNLIMSKTGYNTYKEFGYGITGNGTAYFNQKTLRQVPNGTIEDFTATFEDSLEGESYGAIMISGRYLRSSDEYYIPSRVYISIFLGLDSTLSGLPDQHEISRSAAVQWHDSTFTAIYHYSDAIESGDIQVSNGYYLIAYPKWSRGPRYYDPTINQNVQWPLGKESNVIFVDIPIEG
ncbi:MAG: carboxypeptidase-like regulatory domain-containing protein [Candidatus Marinimicrobia bacterium]|nr:carboxypeptidase-like regulatory domain-containing protein [Candidatus Neomarinimicrobiota bacterium]